MARACPVVMTSRHRHDATRVAVGQPFEGRTHTPHSGIRVAATNDPASDAVLDEPTLLRVSPFSTEFESQREPATEPHLVAANPFDERPAPTPPCQSGLRPGPLSETRLDIAPPVSISPAAAASRARRNHHTGPTLCSPGVVHPDAEPTALDFPYAPNETPSSVAGVPRPLVRTGGFRGWALALSEIALEMALAIGRLISRR